MLRGWGFPWEDAMSSKLPPPSPSPSPTPTERGGACCHGAPPLAGCPLFAQIPLYLVTQERQIRCCRIVIGAPQTCCFLSPTCKQRSSHPSSQRQELSPCGMERGSLPSGLTRPILSRLSSQWNHSLSNSASPQVKDTWRQRAFNFYNYYFIFLVYALKSILWSPHHLISL